MAWLYASGCKQQNHIDKYHVEVDSLLLLPDHFYGYRHGEVYVTNLDTPQKYMVWFHFDKTGDRIHHISVVNDYKGNRWNTDRAGIVADYGWDTLQWKKDVQKFVDLSRKYKISHLYMERNNMVYFSYHPMAYGQYVKPLNDSVTHIYRTDEKYHSLPNGWFESTEHIDH